jgi:ABC-type multidrug transport system fused ATPase/permease subunit
MKNWDVGISDHLSTIPLLLIATNLFKNGVKKTFTEVRNAVASLNAFTNEHISGMRIVQLFNREKLSTKNLRKLMKNIKSLIFVLFGITRYFFQWLKFYQRCL